MVFNSHELLLELEEFVNSHIKFAVSLKDIAEAELQYKTSENVWSVLECIEHLNLYADFYNKELKRRMKASSLKANETFKSGYLGNKSALDMLPKAQMKKMRTFKSKNPMYSQLRKDEVLDDFMMFQEELLGLLAIAAAKNLTKIT